MIPVQRGRARALSALRGSNSGLLVLALMVGAGAGGGAIAFRWLITEFTRALSGHADYSIAGHAANPLVPGLGRWFVLLAPVAAGLVYSPLVHVFAREARGHGVPEVMYAVARRGGRIAPQVAAVKALASALCIGGGGSVGREGPIVQIGSALGSTIGLIVRVAESRMRVLIACGTAGGIAATFNAPLAGVFFAMELILRDLTAESFGMVVLASVTASVIGRGAFGSAPFLHLPPFTVVHLIDYPLFAALGLLAGVIGVAFTRVLYLVEDGCDTAWRGPEWARPAVGGLLLGGVLLVLPQMYGVGYPVLGNGVAGRYSIGFLLALLAGKIIATSLTIGIGGSGGVFAPSLFIGAMTGAARGPITAVVIMFELTGEYSIILPLMTAIVLATGVSHLLTGDTIYLKLRRRGVDLDQPAPTNALAGVTAGQVMDPVGPAITPDTSLLAAVDQLGRTRHGQLPVLDADGAYRGVLTARAAADLLADGQHDAAPVAAALERPQTVSVADSLEAALDALDEATTAIPVLDAERANLVGWLTHQRVLLALRDTRSHRPAPLPSQATNPPAPAGPS